MDMLELCLSNTVFEFRGQVYQQISGVPMGSPVSPLVAEIFMAHFEKEALETSPVPVQEYFRYVDDTFNLIEANNVDVFEKHLSDKVTSIDFTHEVEKDGQLPFLDTLVKRTGDKLSTSVYRKGTHTGQYLQFSSHHPLQTKIGIAKTLLHRAKDICSDSASLDREKAEVCDSLKNCGFPKWALKEALNPRPLRTSNDNQDS